MTFRVIGLSGPAGCGKDTGANYLCHEYDFVRYAFATPLKAALNAMFGWRGFEWNNRTWKEEPLRDIGKSPRQLAQTLGTEWGRQLVHPDLWLLLAKREIERARECGESGIVFTDCRFANEAQFVRNEGGLVIHVSRKGCEPVAAHASENGLPERLVDAVVINDTSLEDYYAALHNVVRYWPTRDVPSGTGVHFTGHRMLDESVARMPDEAAPRCGHMSRTKRVCTQPEGHRLRHNDGVALWDSHE